MAVSPDHQYWSWERRGAPEMLAQMPGLHGRCVEWVEVVVAMLVEHRLGYRPVDVVQLLVDDDALLALGARSTHPRAYELFGPDGLLECVPPLQRALWRAPLVDAFLAWQLRDARRLAHQDAFVGYGPARGSLSACVYAPRRQIR